MVGWIRKQQSAKVLMTLSGGRRLVGKKFHQLFAKKFYILLKEIYSIIGIFPGGCCDQHGRRVGWRLQWGCGLGEMTIMVTTKILAMALEMCHYHCILI